MRRNCSVLTSDMIVLNFLVLNIILEASGIAAVPPEPRDTENLGHIKLPSSTVHSKPSSQNKTEKFSKNLVIPELRRSFSLHLYRQGYNGINNNTSSNDSVIIRLPQSQLDHKEDPPVLRKKDKFLFRIGLIVPKTAFSSQYKIYTQRIKDHLLQLSRHHQTHNDRLGKGLGVNVASSSSVSVGGPKSITSPTLPNQQNFDGTGKSSTTSCSTNTGKLISQMRVPWQDLTFNQHFDIRVVDLVSFAPRSSAQDVVESMCQKLIEQNVSVVVYLENNQDRAVTTSSDIQPFIQLTSPLVAQQTRPMLRNHVEGKTNLSDEMSLAHRGEALREQHQQKAEISHSLESPLKTISSNGLLKTSLQAHFIMHLAHSAGIPMIAWSVTAAQAQRPKKQKTLHLAPTVAHEAEAMLAIMKRYSWYSFSVVSTTLAGHNDFILALRHSMAIANGGSSSAPVGRPSRFEPKISSATSGQPMINNTSIGDDKYNNSSRSFTLASEVSPQLSRTFKLLDVITIRERTSAHIEGELRKLTVSESRVVLLYSTKGEAVEILRVANRLKLNKRSYAWIVAQSVIGPNEDERAPPEFHPGLLGIYFRSNHERLLDELSRAITIIAHGLEGLIRDERLINENSTLSGLANETIQKILKVVKAEKLFDQTPTSMSENLTDIHDTSGVLRVEAEVDKPSTRKRQGEGELGFTRIQFIMSQYHKLLTAHSRCYGKPDIFSERRRDLLYEYFRKSSPWNEFDADGLLKNVELNVVNLDNERQWRRIGCFSNATLTIDDITWPEQAERPPSGTMEKFHLRAVFLEEPSFLNLADPDTETGSCKTNRAVRCRFRTIKKPANGYLVSNNQSTSNNSTIHSNAYEQTIQNVSRAKVANTEDYEYKCCSGFCIDLIEKFATDLKFSYELYRVPDGLWGILENNSWNGLIGEITKAKADVIVSSIKINSDRQGAVDFTVPFLDTGISILVGKQTGVISKLAFLEPFDTLAWIMFICVGIPLATASIFFFELLSPNGFYSKKNDLIDANKRNHGQVNLTGPISEEHHKFSFCRTLWLVITILFGSAAHIDSPKGYTARFMSNVWATFAVVFLAVYTANLAAFMITREEYLELSGINDSRLAYPYHRHPPLKFGTISGGNTHAVLSTNRPKLYEYMRSFNRPTVEDGVESVKRGQLDAFIYDALVLDYLASQDQDCKLVNVGSWYSMTGYALAFPRNSRYYDKFNMKMLEYRKNGELDRLRRFWMQGLCKPGQNRHSKSKPLDLSQFMSAFLLLGAGILCSVFVLVLEHIYILYARDRLLKCRQRRQMLKYLYPFSLSLTDSLRLPNDNNDDRLKSHAKSEAKDELDDGLELPVGSRDATTDLEMHILNGSQNVSDPRM